MLNKAQISIHASSENTVLLSWPEKICPRQHQELISFAEKVRQQLSSVITECLVSYHTVLIYYRFDKIHFVQLKQKLEQCLAQHANSALRQSSNQTAIEVPVYYGEEVGLDLSDVAKQCQLSIAQVIELHSSQNYHAYALGFTPGFCYLGSLPAQLRLPRKETPRVKVPRGAVAIAEHQTAIYPNVSPGGWHIIGQTPLALYQADEDHFSPLISPGCQVKFRAINKQQFLQLGGQLTQQDEG